jgi:phospholipid/cholesterol/gamma-HCH transport system substrate-binding protein
LVTVKNVGLLGERNIEVTLRSAGAPVHVNSDTDTVFIDGSFDSGIAEAIGMFGDILNQATGLVDTVEYLINNTLASPQFITFFTTQLDRIDEITLLTESLISANDDNISRIIDDLTVAGEKVKNITVDNEENLQAITTNFSEFSQRALMLENQIDTTVQNLKSISAKVDTGSGTAAHLINESDLRIQLEETLLAVDSLVQVVDEDGLKLLIRLGTRKRWERD